MSAKPGSSHRHTKIIFTVGPATCEKEVLRSLVRTGVDVCRLNMAHASHDWTRETVARLREVCEEEQRHIAVMMDVKGPEIRTGFVDEPIELKEGQQLQLWMKSTFAPSPHPDVHRVDVNYRELGEDVNIGDVILVDSGLIRLEILEITVDCVVTKVVIGGELGSRRHINLPGVEVNLPSLTEKDLGDLAVGVEVGMDLVALSFVRNAEAVRELRNRLSAMGSLAKIVSKIEDQAGIRNLESIVKATDVVMVARGDLGVEIPFEELPMVQNEAVRICLTHGTPVIIATHMLESMVDSPFPTRAEITDIANAVREQADCIMLSGETTTGKYPLECVRVMHRIIDATEGLNPNERNHLITLREPKSKLVRSATVLAQELDRGGILLFTRSGQTAKIAAALRPNGIPIYAFTDKEETFRQMLILWGIEPFLIPFSDDLEGTIHQAFHLLREKNWCQPGSRLAVITTSQAGEDTIDVLQLRTLV